MSAGLEDALAGLQQPTPLERARALDRLRVLAERAATAPAQLVGGLCAMLETDASPDKKELLELALELAARPALRSELEARSASLARFLEAPDEGLRLAVVPVLAALPGARALLTPPLQRHALEDESQAVRLGCLFALAALEAPVAELASGLHRTERDPLDRLAGALALMQGAVAQVDRAMAELALRLSTERAVLLRCGDVPLLGNPRAMLASALARHPDPGLRALIFERLLGLLGDENWIDDSTASGLLELGEAGGAEALKQAAHLVATRAFGPTGGLDLIHVLGRAGLPTDPAVLQRFLGRNLIIGQWPRPDPRRPWWQFWRVAGVKRD